MPDATQILLESDWLPKCPNLFQSVVRELSYSAATMSELRQCLTAPPKDSPHMQKYLFGEDRTNVFGKIEEAVLYGK